MMDCVFQFGPEKIAIRIDGNSLYFAKLAGSFLQFATIDGLKFNRNGILKEFPDLKDLEFGEMRIEAIKRFKDKISKMQSEDEIKEYLKKDLINHGYILISILKPGFRARSENGRTG